VRSHFLLLFSKVQLCKFSNCTFLHFKKNDRTITLRKERLCKNVWKKCKFPNCTFLLFLKRAIPHFQNGRLPNPACLWALCTFKNLHLICTFLHIRSFQKCDCAIALFVALSKSAIVGLHFFSHFSKSAIAQLLFRKVQMCKKCANFQIALSKERSHIFKVCDCLTLRSTLKWPTSDLWQKSHFPYGFKTPHQVLSPMILIWKSGYSRLVAEGKRGGRMPPPPLKLINQYSGGRCTDSTAPFTTLPTADWTKC